MRRPSPEKIVMRTMLSFLAVLVLLTALVASGCHVHNPPFWK
jgi:hypothetical protein